MNPAGGSAGSPACALFFLGGRGTAACATASCIALWLTKGCTVPRLGAWSVANLGGFLPLLLWLWGTGGGLTVPKTRGCLCGRTLPYVVLTGRGGKDTWYLRICWLYENCESEPGDRWWQMHLPIAWDPVLVFAEGLRRKV